MQSPPRCFFKAVFCVTFSYTASNVACDLLYLHCFQYLVYVASAWWMMNRKGSGRKRFWPWYYRTVCLEGLNEFTKTSGEDSRCLAWGSNPSSRTYRSESVTASSGCIVSGWKPQGSNPSKGKDFLFSVCPDRLWHPPSLLSNGRRVLFLWE
jgi:hypothetical protein